MLAGLSFQSRAEFVVRRADVKACSLPFSPEVDQELYHRIVMEYIIRFDEAIVNNPGRYLEEVRSDLWRELADYLFTQGTPTHIRLYNDLIETAGIIPRCI